MGKKDSILLAPEEKITASYAVSAHLSKGRKYPEKEHAWRSPFQRDRDRIIHSAAFRRLQYKTQVFVNHEGDHYRTRLTHTIETSQIARTIGRVLKLNEDLIETLALAHDLGHGPFGHAGEWALQDLMRDHGGFEHNRQCLRIVETLEDSYPEFPGLNLTFEVIEGLKKHPEKLEPKKTRTFRSLEADVVDLADEIAYTSHDLDDGLRSELINVRQVRGLRLWDDGWRYAVRKYRDLEERKLKRLMIRLIINRLVTDVIEQSQKNIKKFKITSVEDIQGLRQKVIDFSPDIKRAHAELKRFLFRNLYQNYRVLRMTDKGQRFLKELFEWYLAKPELLPEDVRRRSQEEGVPRAVCDYLAGMTDRFALDEYQRYSEPYERV